MKKPLTLLGVSAVVGFGVLALSSVSAQAVVPDHYPTDNWNVRSINSAGVWLNTTDSKVVDKNTIKLVRTDGKVGTSAETTNLGLPGSKVTVKYTLSGGASTAAGAVRLFVYDTTNADTLTKAPTKVATADDNTVGSHTLTIDTGFTGNIGTMGLVYDASNDSTGTVTFTDLKVDETNVLFEKAPVVVPPTTTPSTKPSSTPSAKPNVSPPANNDGGSLPVTGDNTTKIVATGVVLLVGGGVIFFLSRRRRRTNFVAE